MASPANEVGCLLVFGLGYCGTAIAVGAVAAGYRVVATSRTPEGKRPPHGVELIAFDAATDAIAAATHILETAAPDEHGDPALARHAVALAAAPSLRWAGMLSTTGVYGDRGGGWVDETTPP
ncbi:MAG: SDR family NAD(P)-dependent oxidoreductase, partial [Sphingomonas sp.]